MRTTTQEFCCRLYTEDITPNDARLEAMGITPEVLVGLEFPTFTMFRPRGTWEREYERALVFEFIGDKDLEACVLKVAEDIRKRCGQWEVIVTTHPVQVCTFTGD